jgi:Tol biopolymer transport system component
MKLLNRVIERNPIRTVTFALLAILLISCHSVPDSDLAHENYIAPRGGNPAAQSIRWSPANEDIILVFGAETPSSPVEIYTYNIQTKDKNVIVKERPGFLFDATWTPDGEHILIMSQPDMPGYQPHGWWLMNIESGTKNYFLESGDIAYSPDGKTIAFLRETRASDRILGVELYLINVATREESLVYSNLDVDHSRGISWSSDGQSLAFSLCAGSHCDLYIWLVEKNILERITQDGRNQEPVWSPAGYVLAYLMRDESDIARHYLMLTMPDKDCDLKLPTRETVLSASWSPDGKYLAYLDVSGIYSVDVEKAFDRNIYQNFCN